MPSQPSQLIIFFKSLKSKKYFCGTEEKPSTTTTRYRRFVESGSKWSGENITYAIENYTEKLGERKTRYAINSAIRHWKRYVPLPIIEIKRASDKSKADIRIIFASGTHGDNTPFDGTGGFLAHAFYPGPGLGGDTHFDDEEPWTLNKAAYTGKGIMLSGLRFPAVRF